MIKTADDYCAISPRVRIFRPRSRTDHFSWSILCSRIVSIHYVYLFRHRLASSLYSFSSQLYIIPLFNSPVFSSSFQSILQFIVFVAIGHFCRFQLSRSLSTSFFKRPIRPITMTCSFWKKFFLKYIVAYNANLASRSRVFVLF